MSNYTNLKNAIRSVIKANGNNEITGPILQAELLSMITTLGAGYQYMGVAQPSTNPGTPDARVMYLAYLPGTYVNFGGLAVTGFCVLKYDTVWSKEDIPISGGGGADFLTEPDDLTLEAVGNTNILKFANRSYNSENPNGLGYKILRKDLTFAEQVTTGNTIYEIRYGFNLNGQTLDFGQIGENIILKFTGGFLSNGTINGANTVIDAPITKIFDTNITLTGTWNLINAFPEWFGAVADGTTDCTIAIQKLDGFPIKFSAGIYILSNVILHGGTLLIGSGIEKTILKQKANSVDDLIILQDWFGGCMRDLSVKADTTATLSGNGFQTALVKLRSEKRTPNNTYNYYSSIDNVFIGGAGSANRINGLSLLGVNEVDNGFVCAPNWVFHISNMWIRHCGGYGIYDASTDNLFNTLDVGTSGYAHIYEKGSSNMWVNAKLDGNFYPIDGTAEEIYNMEDKGALLIVDSGGIVNMLNFDLQDSRYCGAKIIRCTMSHIEMSANYIGNNAPVADITYSKNFYIKTLTNSVLKLCCVRFTGQDSCIGLYRISNAYLNKITLVGDFAESDYEIVKKLLINNVVVFPNGVPQRRKFSGLMSNNIVFNNIFLKNIINDDPQDYFSYTRTTKETASPIYANTPYYVFDNSESQALCGIAKRYPIKAIRKESFYILMFVARIDKLPTGTGQIWPYTNTSFNAKSPNISFTIRTRSETPSVGDVYIEAHIFSYSLNDDITSQYIQAGLNMYLAAASNGKFSIGNFCLYEITDFDIHNLLDAEIVSTVPSNAPFTTDLILKFNSTKNVNSLEMDSVSRGVLFSNANQRNNGRLLFDTDFREWVYFDGTDWISATTGLPVAKRSGEFSAKPSFSSGTNAGFQYYDATNKRYIVWNGTEWTNIDGTPLT